MEPWNVPFFHGSSGVREAAGCYSGVYHHDGPLAKGDAHTQWWPSEGILRTIVLFIPGNPGLIDFYTPFLSKLHREAVISDSGFAILAHAHLGHSPHLKVDKSMQGLLHQVDAALQVFDAIKAYSPDVKIVLTGHSVGAWIATQILKSRQNAADALFLLFPTISEIGKTPNGKRLSWAFRAPFPSLAARLSVLIRPITYILFPFWPKHQRSVIRSLLCSPRSIFACLAMGHEEMCTITELDSSLLKQYSAKVWFCYAKKDDWVGGEQAKVIQSLGSDVAAIQVVQCEHGVTHAFCIFHGDIVAGHCADWLRAGNLLQ